MKLIWMQEFRDEEEALKKQALLRKGMLFKKIAGEVKCAHRVSSPSEKKAGKFDGKWMVTQFLEA